MVVFNRSTNVRKLTCIWSIQYISPNIPVCGWHHNYRERVAVNKEMTELRICSSYFEVVTSNVKRHHHKFNPYKICTLKTTTDVPFPIITALSFSQTNHPVWNRSNIMVSLMEQEILPEDPQFSVWLKILNVLFATSDYHFGLQKNRGSEGCQGVFLDVSVKIHLVWRPQFHQDWNVLRKSYNSGNDQLEHIIRNPSQSVFALAH